MSEEVKKRIYCFDLLKVISIICVFFHHIMMDLYIVHPMHDLSILSDIILRPNANLGMIACGMFILISGATLALKGREENPIEFYKKRLIRILIPFYIAYIICFVIRVYDARTFFIFNGVNPIKFIFTIVGMDEYLSANNITTFSLGVGEWFLGCIMLCYFIYPFLYKIHKKNKFIVFIIMTMYYLLINYNYDKLNFYIPSHMNFFCQIYNFYLGIFLIDKEMLSKVNKYLLIITIPIILFFYFYKILIPVPDNIKTSIVIIAIFIKFYALEEYISSFRPLITFTIFFNKISLEIYLVHHFIIYQVDFMLSYRALSGFKTLFVIVFDIIMTIMLAFFVELASRKVTETVNKCKNK